MSRKQRHTPPDDHGSIRGDRWLTNRAAARNGPCKTIVPPSHTLTPSEKRNEFNYVKRNRSGSYAPLARFPLTETFTPPFI
jgi:hypothetical protein